MSLVGRPQIQIQVEDDRLGRTLQSLLFLDVRGVFWRSRVEWGTRNAFLLGVSRRVSE